MTIEQIMTGNLVTPENLEAEEALLSQGTHDDGNAVCVMLRHRDQFAYNKAFGWLHHTGTHWTRDGAEAAVGNATIETLQARLQAAANSKDPKRHGEIFSKCIPDARRVGGAMKLLSYKTDTDPALFAEEEHLLNARNGVIDLRTGQILPHGPEQRFMSCLPISYDPDADQSFWKAFLVDAVGKEAADWLQIAVGYSLTGSTAEEVLFYLYGPPRSGKGTFTETILTMLGSPLAEAIPFDLLTAPRDVDTQNFRLAPLRHTRFVTASESNPYERFNEAKLKALTGGDSIQCAYKHHDPFTYRPGFKIWLSSNQAVNADPDDDAAWGRLRVIEFPNSHLGDENKTLKSVMRSRDVQEGVLSWSVQGAGMWYANGARGLPVLEASEQLKRQHRGELDRVQAWLEENCRLMPGRFTSNSTLYQNYEQWCKANGVEAKKQKGFGLSLQKKGFQTGRDERGARGYNGIVIAF